MNSVKLTTRDLMEEMIQYLAECFGCQVNQINVESTMYQYASNQAPSATPTEYGNSEKGITWGVVCALLVIVFLLGFIFAIELSRQG